MKKVVVGIVAGLLLATQTINAEAATTAKPTLQYKATLSVDAGIIGGITLTCKSMATNKSTGAAVSIDSIKTAAKIICKDGTSTSKSTTKKKASSCTCSFYRVDVKKYTGTHTFENTGYKTKTLSTSKSEK